MIILLHFFLVILIKCNPSINGKNIPIITFLNSAYGDILKNFICNLKILNLEKNLHVYLVDKKLKYYLDRNNISNSLVNLEVSEDLSVYGEKEYWNIAKKKIFAFIEATQNFGEFVFSDVDILWLQNPLVHLKKDCNMYICFQPDHEKYKEKINTGFFYVKNPKFAITFFQEAAKLIENSEFQMYGSQAIVDHLLTNKYNYKNFTSVLDPDNYPNGGRKNYWNYNLLTLKKRFPDMKVLHNNWIRTKKSKIDRFKKNKSWFLNDQENCITNPIKIIK